MTILRKRIRRFGELTGSERLLLGRALVVVGAVRMSLWIGPLSVARRIAEAAAGTSHRDVQQPMDNKQRMDSIIWAVSAASRYIPKATCLTQAIAGQALLARAGCLSRIDVGVAKRMGFEAHASLVAGKRVVLGARESSRFETILALE